jgi:hypothetical protein
MALYDDKTNQAGVNQLMDFSEKEEEPIVPSEDYDPASKFLQRGLNAYASVAGLDPLKEDGILGPKTQAATQGMLKGLPPEMKRWAVNSLYKEMNKTEGDGGAGNKEGFEPPGADAAPDIVGSMASEGNAEFMQNVVDKDIKY